ncbi:ureidoglycolate hydrolase [Aspergillus granulosus]|uniref:Ureidoglycolate hydrolase n=1 Tax=Aspergillus granulosus TaxID=176169 RepID=A0ABR4HH67_9EURO
MSPPTLYSSPYLSLTPEPLTRDSFAPFGTAIIPPLPRTVTRAPNPLSSHPKHSLVPEPVAANQLSALKYSPISPLLDNYTGKCPSGKASEARMTMFSCFPRQLRTSTTTLGGKEAALFDVTILERHPYTTQTFSPLALSPDEETFYLVIVAPTLTGQTATAKTDSGEEVTIRDPPDLSKIKVFKARGDQAVTYGAGTWHAPMVVVGTRRVDFVVVQFVNGVGEEDCQEVRFPEGLVVQVGSSDGEKGAVKSKL